MDTLRFVAIFICAVCLGGHAYAGSRSLGDLTPGSGDSINGIAFGATLEAAYVDGTVYFPIRCELWKTDGLPTGTSRVVDLTAGAGAQCRLNNFIAVNGTVVFVRDPDNVTGHDTLWLSNGTSVGTAAVSVSGFPLAVNGRLNAWPGEPGLVYFATSSGSTYSVWVTDGSDVGTIKLTDTTTTSHFAPSETFLADHTMVIVHDGLWTSDGTVAGTQSISTAVMQGGGGILVGDLVIFRAFDATHGRELWVSDLTSVGTHILEDLTSGPGDSPSGAGGSQVLNGSYFFEIGDNLWKTDGTVGGTVQLTATGALVAGNPIATIGNQIYFPGQQADGNFYWWTSDGTVAGTKSIATNPISFSTTNPVGLTSRWSNDLIFSVGNQLRRITGQVGADFTVGTWEGEAGSFRRVGDVDVVGTRADMMVIRGTKPRVLHDAYPSLNDISKEGEPGGAMHFFSQNTATTGTEPWTMDLTDLDIPACSYPGKPIQDFSRGGRTDIIHFPQTMKAGKLRVFLNIPHTYIGDLSAKLTHVESGKSVQLFSRPGIPNVEQMYGCPSNDLDIVLDDSAPTVIGDTCNTDPDAQAFPPGTVLRPTAPLSGFAGDDLTGDWKLQVIDNSTGDTGGLQSWCLQNVDRIFSDDLE